MHVCSPRLPAELVGWQPTLARHCGAVLGHLHTQADVLVTLKAPGLGTAPCQHAAPGPGVAAALECSALAPC